MTEEELVRRVDAGVSPYLQQPLRTLEQAELDCKHRQRKIADIEVYGDVVSAWVVFAVLLIGLVLVPAFHATVSEGVKTIVQLR